jgi:alpha-1,2-mannosyltransferase
MKLILKRLGYTGLIQWFILIIALGVIVAALLMFMNSKPNILYYIKNYFVGNGGLGQGDSWSAMFDALTYIKKHPADSVYDAMFARDIKFQYPLSSLLVFDLPERLFGWSYVNTAIYLDYISRLSVIGTGLVSGRILTNILKEDRFLKLRPSNAMQTVLLYGLVMVTTIMFYPLMRSYYLGQIQTLLTFMAAVSILSWQSNRKILTGIIIGFICLIKPQLGLLFFWALIRKQWSMVISGAVVIGIFMLVAIGMYGFAQNMEYLKILSFLSHHGESFYANQSVNGLMNRLVGNGSNVVWDHKFPPYHGTVYIFTLISSLVLMLTGLLWKYKKINPDIIDFSIIILCTTMASPIAWEHHYGILLPIFVLMSPFVYDYFIDRKWVLGLFAFGYLLTAQYFENTKYLAGTSLNVLQSYLFFGACILFGLLLTISNKSNRYPAENVQPDMV